MMLACPTERITDFPNTDCLTQNLPKSLEGPIREVTLDTLPEEILVQIFVHVPFNRHVPRTIGQICRRFRGIVQHVDSHSFLRQVAEEQFPLVNLALGTSGSKRYTIGVLESLKEVHDAATFILNEVRASMTDEDFDAESEDWERELFHCLVMWEKVSRLCATNCLWSIGKIRHFYDLLSLDAHLSMRYVCAKLVKCMCHIFKRYAGRPHDVAWAARLGHLFASWEMGRLATALEQMLLHGRGLQALCDILEAIPRTFNDLQENQRRLENYRFFGDCATRTFSYTESLSQHTFWSDTMQPAVWLCSPESINTQAVDERLRVSKMQSYITRMIRESTMNDDLDLEEFICHHRPIKAVMTNVQTLQPSGIINRRQQANDLLRKYLGQARAAAQGGPVNLLMLKPYILTFDWESALDTELLRGDSRLRRSLPSTDDILDQAFRAVNDFEIIHESSD